jgi:hypothetical protein
MRFVRSLVLIGIIAVLAQILMVSHAFCLKPTDLNADNITDVEDVLIALAYFGTHPGHPRWNPAADINEDNYVGIHDIVLIATDFGETWV